MINKLPIMPVLSVEDALHVFSMREVRVRSIDRMKSSIQFSLRAEHLAVGEDDVIRRAVHHQLAVMQPD